MSDKKTPHANNSFANLVANESSRQAKEVIEPLIREYVAFAANQIKDQISRASLKTMAEIRTRLTALEKLLIEKGVASDTEISEKILDVEDAATGMVQGTEAQEGDLLRVSYRSKSKTAEKETDYSPAMNRVIAKLGSANTFSLAVEKALIGASKGSKVEVSEDTTLKQADGTDLPVTKTYDFSIIRISRSAVATNGQQS